MTRRILIIQAHPDPEGTRYCQALADAYSAGACEAGHEVELLRLAEMEIPFIRNEQQWTKEPAPESIDQAQQAILAADHLVFVFPIWLGTMPALLKAFLEQVLRPGFAFDPKATKGLGGRRLKGKSARVIMTMGMPGFFFRHVYRGHGYRYFKRNILKFCGIGPVRHCYVGLATAKRDTGRKKWLEKVRVLGRKAL